MIINTIVNWEGSEHDLYEDTIQCLNGKSWNVQSLDHTEIKYVPLCNLWLIYLKNVNIFVRIKCDYLRLTSGHIFVWIAVMGFTEEKL